MLAKEKAARCAELPVFYKRIGEYGIYYLQIPSCTGRQESVKVKAWLQKGIYRLQKNCGEETDTQRAYIVYDGAFERWLEENQMTQYWQSLWEQSLYREFTQPHNLLFLLQQIPERKRLGNWIMIGEALGVEEWIGGLARYMKSVTFFSMDPPGNWERLREHLQKEFGLIVDWKRSFQPIVAEPAFILDYCTKEKLFVWDVCRGSIWVDMNSLEYRRHDLQDRDTGIFYYSLKRFWREEMIQTLDTVSKIQYNT